MSDDFLIRGVSSENYLTLLVWDDHNAKLLAEVLTPDLFADQNTENVAKAAINHIKTYGKAPKHHIKDLFEGELRRPGGHANLMMALFDNMEGAYPTLDVDYVLGELDKFIRIRRRRLAMEEANLLLDQGDEAAADDLLWRYTGVTAQTASLTPGVFLHDTDLGFMTQRDSDFFSSGIEALDVRGITPSRKTMMLFIAAKKQGKSWCCINVGKAGIRHRHKVLHISLENSEELTKRRYVQSMWSMTKKETETISLPYFTKDARNRWAGTVYEDRQPIALTMDNQDYIRDRLSSLNARPPLLIKQFASGTLTIARYNAYLDYLERQFRFIPDLVIVDYPDLMAIDSRQLRVETGRMFTALRGVAVDRNHALFCPTQGNRESQDARWVTSKNVSEDWSKAGTADIVLTFNRTPQERELGLARIMVDAARDEEDSFSVMITQSYTTGQFCIDSVMMDAKVTEEVNKVWDGKAAMADVEETSEE